MRADEELRALAQGLYSDYMAGNPFSEDAQDGYSSALGTLSSEELVRYRELSAELSRDRAAQRNQPQH